MTQQDIQDSYARIIGLLERKALKDALQSMQSLIIANKDLSMMDRLEELESTYKYMLQYNSTGTKDPMQKKIYENLLLSAYQTADKIRNTLLFKGSPLTYYSSKRNLEIASSDTPISLYKKALSAYEVTNFKETDFMNNRLFERIWASDFLTTTEIEEIRSILTDPNLPSSTGSLIVSALWMGLQQMFDKEKVLLLFDAANSPDEDIQIRALISILLTLYIYAQRAQLVPQIQKRLSTLADTPGFTVKIRTIILRFILARETEKITRRLQEEIIPEMMKLSPQLSNKINLSALTPEQINDEMNPEWKNFQLDSKLGKKMEEFSELQQEGADIMHSTFTHLKNFQFFKTLSNWFLPFSTDYHLLMENIQGDAHEKQLLDSMSTAAFMCDSDKYSFYFSLMQMPAEARNMMMGQFDAQASELIQQNKEEIISRRGKTEMIAGQYIQDLYRFYKLHPSRGDFEDIFLFPLDFHQLDILKPYINDTESLQIIAEYYLHKNYFADALKIFKTFIASQTNDEIIWQKIGYCYQMEGHIKEALDAYLHADILNPSSQWATRRIAACYRAMKQPAEALKYYQRYEKLNPDNLSISINIGHCYLELKDYDAALKYFFKVDYLDNKSHKAWRPIAWCSFLTGKYDQAKNYYKKIISDTPNAQDYLNAGHTEWALQNIKGAIEYYLQAIKLEDGDWDKFESLFIEDINELTLAGIEPDEIALMKDQLRYKLTE